jgi:gliding motility-associated protein GldC
MLDSFRDYGECSAGGYDAAMEPSHTSQIRIAVTTGEGGVQAIRWQADDAPEPGEQRADAMLLALWDPEHRNALRIDLWTREMTVDDMNDFVFQTLISLADTYRAATKNDSLMADIKIFAREFAEKASAAERRAQGAGGTPPR